jgi:hypothetical protein
MVLDYYKLREHPFGVTPDSRYLFLSASHQEALASLLYGIEAGRGFIALIAGPGMGKTTLLFHALNQLRRQTNRGTVPLPVAAGSPSSQSPPTVAPAETEVQANDVVPSLPAAARSSSDQGPSPTVAAEIEAQTNGTVSSTAPVANANQNQPIAAETTIRVASGRTLLGICVENFGSCNSQLLQEIHKLNARLSNLDHIEAGQKILLPSSTAKQSITQLQGRASLAERNTQ